MIKLQAGLDNKVCPDSRVLTICFDICNVVLTEIYRLIALADCVDETTSLYVSTHSAGQAHQTQSSQTSRSSERRLKRRAKKTENGRKKQTEGRPFEVNDLEETRGESSVRPSRAQEIPKTKSWQKNRQKVFVNVITKRVSVPSYVLRMLNLGANYQLASYPQVHKRIAA